MGLEEVVQFLQEKMHAYPYDDDEVVELLQASMFELKRMSLDTPPPPTKEEIPQLPPGSTLTRGTYLTASARARKNKDRGKIIRVPVERPPSPPSPDKLSPIPGLPTSRNTSPQSTMNRSAISMSSFSDSTNPQVEDGSTVITVPRQPMLARSPRDRRYHNHDNGPQRMREHRMSEGHGVELVRYKPASDGQMLYSSESVLVRSDNPSDRGHYTRRPTADGTYAHSTFRPINGDVDALKNAAKPGGAPVWQQRPSEHQVTFTFV